MAASRRAVGIFAGSLAGLATGVVAFALTPGFRLAFDPSTKLIIGASEYGWQMLLVVQLLLYGVPSLIGGALVTVMSRGRYDLLAGILGIAIGCWWRDHLERLGATLENASDYGSGTLTGVSFLGGGVLNWLENLELAVLLNGGGLIGVCMLLLPIICAVVLTQAIATGISN